MTRPDSADAARGLDVAVVIAAYRAERTLAGALASIAAQTLPVAEVVVVDDGSDDATAAIATRWGNPVRAIRLDTNRGVAHALNTGIAATTAPVLMILDADDLWAPTAVEHLCAALAAAPSVEAVFGQTAQFTDPACAMDVAAAAAAAGPPQPGLHKSTMAVRRVAFDRVGAFDPSFDRADMVEWLARASAAHLRIGTVERVVHYRRLHDQNMGRLHREEQRRQYAEVMRAISRRRRETT